MVTTAVTMMGQGIISPVLPLFAREFGLSMAMVGVTVAVFSLGRIFFNVPAGVAGFSLVSLSYPSPAAPGRAGG
jgi:MFS family permease